MPTFASTKELGTWRGKTGTKYDGAHLCMDGQLSQFVRQVQYHHGKLERVQLPLLHRTDPKKDRIKKSK